MQGGACGCTGVYGGVRGCTWGVYRGVRDGRKGSQLLGADLALIELLYTRHVHRRPLARDLGDLYFGGFLKRVQPHRRRRLAPRAHLGRPARAARAVGAYARAQGGDGAAAADDLGTEAAFVEGAPRLRAEQRIHQLHLGRLHGGASGQSHGRYMEQFEARVWVRAEVGRQAGAASGLRRGRSRATAGGKAGLGLELGLGPVLDLGLGLELGGLGGLGWVG